MFARLKTTGPGARDVRSGHSPTRSTWASRPIRCAVLGVAVLSFATVAPAQPKKSLQATSSRAAREEALRTLPLDRLDEETAAKVSYVIKNTSIYRRLPTHVIDADPNLYLFLVRHPEVIVNIWEVMGISKVVLERTAEGTFRAADGVGTTGIVQICHSTADTQLIYAEGAYDGPLFERKIQAKCVLLLRSGYILETNGRYYITSRLDAFIHIEHLGLELLAKTFQPLVTRSADYNFVETLGFLSNVSQTAERNPPGMMRLANKLVKVEPEVRVRFSELIAEKAKKSNETEAASTVPQARLTSRAQNEAGSESR